MPSEDPEEAERRAREAAMEALAEALRRRVGDRIRATAERKGISLRVLAQRADISRGHLGNVLAGSAAASTDLLARLAYALDVDPDVLVKRYRKPTPPA